MKNAMEEIFCALAVSAVLLLTILLALLPL